MLGLTRRLIAGLAPSAMAAPFMAEEAPLRVGSTAGPYAENTDFVAKPTHEQGLGVSVVEFTDYVLPNEALSHGDTQVSNFQNLPYLDNVRSLADLPHSGLVAIPNAPSEGARSLDDRAAAAVNLDYAISAGTDPVSALAKEDQDTRYGLWLTYHTTIVPTW